MSIYSSTQSINTLVRYRVALCGGSHAQTRRLVKLFIRRANDFCDEWERGWKR